MIKKISLSLLVLASLIWCNCTTQKPDKPITWSLVLKQPGNQEVLITDLPEDISKPFSFQRTIQGCQIEFTLEPKAKYTVFKAKASGKQTEGIYFSLRANYHHEIPYNFNGVVDSSEIFRQSPHDVNAWIVTKIAEQAVPVIALKSDSTFVVALMGSPALYDNFTSQAYDTKGKTVALSSGDNGETPGLKPDNVKQLDIEYNTEKTQIMAPGKVLAHYHPVSPDKPHLFEGILFKSHTQNLNGLRKDINQLAADHFSGGKYRDYFGALSFTTAYMNLRVNETGKSKYWVVPSVEYGNTQYCRDAFWISTMLPADYSAECLKSELQVVNEYAEYPLFAVIWAYRAWKDHKEVELAKVQKYVDAIETRARNGNFYSYLKSDGRLDFQYWGDVIAFEKDDIVTYNQGLFALALTAAKEMGLRTQTNPELALQNYRHLFNPALGFYPISKKKNTILGPDPLVPDLVAQLYFGRKLLDSTTVRQHYTQVITHAKTPFGLKVYCLPDGNYLPDAMYDIPNYRSQITREKMPDGRYLKGGSYFLYDNLFLIDAYLHGIKEAENELIWRISLDFDMGNTTYECLNTKTGEPWKPNMGWNVAIYSIWRDLVDKGQADDKLFAAIDKISDKSLSLAKNK